jgi:plastocyanin
METLVLAAALALTSGVASTADATVSVHIKDFAFAPKTLSVPAGTVVRFVNDDGEAHTVTAADRSFDSTGLDTGNAWAYRFAKPGRYPYFCALHPYMKGTIVVVPPAKSGKR